MLTHMAQANQRNRTSQIIKAIITARTLLYIYLVFQLKLLGMQQYLQPAYLVNQLGYAAQTTVLVQLPLHTNSFVYVCFQPLGLF